MDKLSAQYLCCRLVWAGFLTTISGLNGQDIHPNAWMKPTSGYWEGAPYWSLDLLPGTNQAVLFTNAGWKALAIGPNTVQKFPQTLNVNSITLSSPSNSFNLLLLNYAGYQTPIAANIITLNSNPQ